MYVPYIHVPYIHEAQVTPEVTLEVEAHEALGAGCAGTKLALSRNSA